MIEWLGNHHFLSFFYIQSHSQYSHSLFLFCSVADINQSLIDDGLVNKEKIGGSNYFWSFPAARDRKMQLEHAKVKEDIQDLKQKVAEASAKLADAKRGREDEDGERAKKLQRLKDLAEERKKAEAELATLKENDPQALADLEKELQLVKAAANRWTDNIFTCKAYLVKKKNMGKKEADAMLGITSAFDCKCMAPSLPCLLHHGILTCHSPVHILLKTPKTRFPRNRFILLLRYTYFQFAVSWRNANMKCDFQTCS